MSKPYKFIPFLRTSSYKVKNDRLKGRIDLEIKVLNAVHLSKGTYDMDSKGVLFKEFMKINHKYAIPGTSIKGMIRNIAEMTSHSCISAQKNEVNYLPKIKKTSCKRDYCIICDVFGAMGKRSKIKVSDFIYEEGSGRCVVKGMPLLRTPKFSDLYKDNGVIKGHKIYNHGIESILKNGKENYQCFMKDSVFKGYILYEDLDVDELRLLCYALGLSNSFNHKLGYGKPAYYGSIEVNCIDEKYKEYAEEYEKNADKDILENIKLLSREYSYKNANKTADYDESTY